MVAHQVQDDSEPAPVGPRHQLPQRLLAAQPGLDGQVIGCIVSVGGGAGEDWAEPDRARAQLGDVVQLLQHAPECASKETVQIRALQPLPSLAGEEPIDKDLVEDRLPSPLRRAQAIDGIAEG